MNLDHVCVMGDEFMGGVVAYDRAEHLVAPCHRRLALVACYDMSSKTPRFSVLQANWCDRGDLGAYPCNILVML
jgi:hypothetical protein